ncbi:MAG: hypothetical protein ACREK7_00845, partial [Gemmatimonadota bacterium]
MPEKDGQARRLAGDPLAGLDADRLKGLLGEAWERPPASTPEERAQGRKEGKRPKAGPSGQPELLHVEEPARVDAEPARIEEAPREVAPAPPRRPEPPPIRLEPAPRPA